MTTLTRDLRRQLENTVRAARRAAEEGAVKSLEQLGVAHSKAPPHLSPAQARLRNALRAHGRQLGDLRNATTGAQAVNRLTAEVAYEHWHRMLFARFLAENDLLIEPDSGMAITLAECQELAREQSEDWLALASRYAQTMLPQIFRAGDPVLDVNLPPETRSQLDDLLKSLPAAVFQADDSLGWVYQFWQADNKDAVNRSGKKIGADELPAVTQLFTEDYMVWFLLHNTLGAWWAGKLLAARPDLAVNATSEAELRAACAVGDIQWTYLRFVRTSPQDISPLPLAGEGQGEGASASAEAKWRPAAGTFTGWPHAAKDITLLDPCMGSGHFLVFALPILAAMRAQEEQLKPDAAIEAVLRDNLYGLELDPRCTQIAAFNLALAAWKRTGYRRLPALHLACSGLSLGVTKAEWLELAERAAAELPVAPERDLLGTKSENLFSDATRRGFERLYDLFARAPVLGSLIQPRAGGDLIEKGFADLEPLIAKVMAKADTAELSEMAVAAQGLAKAAEMLAGRFTLVATNVPYLGRGKQDEVLKNYCEHAHPSAKADLATCFVERCLAFCAEGGSTALVTPQNWLFLGTYKHLRKGLLEDIEWNAVARLGPRAFETITGEVVNVALLALTARRARDEHRFAGWDASTGATPAEKDAALRRDTARVVGQAGQAGNPDGRITFDAPSALPSLGTCAGAYQGLTSGDNPRFMQVFWEQQVFDETWEPTQSASSGGPWSSGRALILRWEQGSGELTEVLGNGVKGRPIWGRLGVAVGQMRTLPIAPYLGTPYDMTCAVIVPDDDDDLPALWSYCSSSQFLENVRRIDQKLNVTNATLVKVPFDLAHWQQVAAEKYPNGLPKPHSDDPTQWLFNGHPKDSDSPLHVAVARLLGYRWPRQTGSSFPDCPALGADGLEKHADDDGIVPLTAIKGEAGAAERLRALLADAYGADWSAARLLKLLNEAGAAGPLLEDWMLDRFFEQHCALFHQRPFVWHLWDGRRDGFNVLVNYHRLAAGNGAGKRLLEKLTHSYLGDWIDVQRRDQKAGVEGADARLAAAEHLKGELEKILAGEPPYDLFVRWKPLAQQAIGWEPDINDGVRMNIRPFMTARPFGARAKNACILRTTPRIKWDKDRGKEPERPRDEFPWFWGWDESSQDFPGDKTFDGHRWNDLHYSTTAKKAARARLKT
ncbi:MAG: N-6 DNA methylase [Pseudomonadota bacterium]